MKRKAVMTFIGLLLVTGLWAIAVSAQNNPKLKEFRIERSMPKEAIACIECHKAENPGLFADWTHSRHASANITCYDCHKAEETDADVSQEHYKQYKRSDHPYGTKEYKVPITAVVTPKDCSRCHPDEAKQYSVSKHANTMEIIWKIDPWLNNGMNSDFERAAGCYHCHGTVLKQKDGKLDPADLAECRRGPYQSGRQQGKLYQLPYASYVFGYGSPQTRSLRPVPPGTGSSADRNLHGIQTW